MDCLSTVGIFHRHKIPAMHGEERNHSLWLPSHSHRALVLFEKMHMGTQRYLFIISPILHEKNERIYWQGDHNPWSSSPIAPNNRVPHGEPARLHKTKP